jgi:hypothetical protein
MSQVFISYRRDESADVADRIDECLAKRYGRENVFKDVYSIRLGDDFREVINEAVGRCQVLLAVIGPHWLLIPGASGGRRLDDPRDLVRLEIEVALDRGIPVIPVLVSGAGMPASDQLPASLQPLTRRNRIAVRRDPDFHADSRWRIVWGPFTVWPRGSAGSDVAGSACGLDSGNAGSPVRAFKGMLFVHGRNYGSGSQDQQRPIPGN